MQAYAILFKILIKKIIGVLAKNGGGKFGNLSSHVGSLLLNMILFASCRVGRTSFISLTFLGLGRSFFPSIWSLICHHDHWSYGSKSCQTSSCVTDMLKSCPFVVTLTSGSLYHPKSFCILSSHVNDVGFIMTPLRQGHFPSTSTHYLGIWSRESLPVP